MLKSLLILSAIPLCTVYAQTQSIAQILSNLPAGKSYTLNRAAAVAGQNPNWGTAGSKTLFVPVDSSNPPQNNRAGTLFVGNQAIDYRTDRTITFYRIVSDVSNTARAVYDNYVKESDFPNEIRLRTGGQADVRVVDFLPATNGFVYVVDGPILDLADLSTVATRQNLNSFLKALQDTGILASVSGMKDITILAPNDAAFASVNAGSLTRDQLIAVLQNHIVSGVTYSTALPTSFTSYLGNNLAIQTGKNPNNGHWETTIGGAHTVIPSDNLGNFGALHIIDAVLVPNPIPPPKSMPAGNTNNSTNGTNTSNNTSIPNDNNNSNNRNDTSTTGTNSAMSMFGNGVTSAILSLTALMFL